MVLDIASGGARLVDAMQLNFSAIHGAALAIARAQAASRSD